MGEYYLYEKNKNIYKKILDIVYYCVVHDIAIIT